MSDYTPETNDDYDDPKAPESVGQDTKEEDLWFLPGPMEDEADFIPPGPRAEVAETSLIDDWVSAEAANVARLARVSWRLGALDQRLRHGPEGWRNRLALFEAAELSWLSGDRVSSDRLALWVALRLSGVHGDMRALTRIGWAVRRLSGGPGPLDDLAAFLDRRDPETMNEGAEPFVDRAGSWSAVMRDAEVLHPISRACMGFHLWSLAGLGQLDDRVEAAVTASRVALSEGQGAIFAPLAMGGAGGLRAGGTPHNRLTRWLDGMDSATLTAMRHIDEIEAWTAKADKEMISLSGRTPPKLRKIFSEWPLVSAPMAEALTGASRAAVQRNLLWMENNGLIREVTGQGRFRMWRVAG